MNSFAAYRTSIRTACISLLIWGIAGVSAAEPAKPPIATGRYRCMALLEIVPTINQDRLDDRTIAREINTHVELLNHPNLLITSLKDENSDLRKTEWFEKFKQDPDATKKQFGHAFKAEAVKDSRLIRVTYTCDIEGDARTILEAIVNEYLREQELLARQRLTDKTAFLNNIKRQYQFKLRDAQEKLRDKIVELCVDNAGVSGKFTIYEQLLVPLLQQQDELQTKYQDLLAESRKAKAPSDDLKSRLESARRVVDHVNSRIKDLKKQWAESAVRYDDYLATKDQEETYRNLLKQVNQQIDGINQQIGAASLRTIQWAAKPTLVDPSIQANETGR